ncbi:hypothetical protein D3C78_1098220 [compost metagenome]
MAVSIPIYSASEIINWPGAKSTDRIGLLARYSHESKSCYFCRSKCKPVDHYCDKHSERDTTPQYIYMCPSCGFWFGRGTREYMVGPAWGKFIFGKIQSFPVDAEEINTEQLISFLNENKAHITKINPFKAEDIVCEILKDYLDCEVRKVGGRKYGGIDGYVLKGNKLSTLIQIKWRRNKEKAEGVQVIRDVAGTQLIKGVPRSIIVTTKNKYSKAARDEMVALHGRELVSVGKMSMDLLSYNDIISMLEVTTRRLSETPSLPVDLGKKWEVFW